MKPIVNVFITVELAAIALGLVRELQGQEEYPATPTASHPEFLRKISEDHSLRLVFATSEEAKISMAIQKAGLISSSLAGEPSSI